MLVRALTERRVQVLRRNNVPVLLSRGLVVLACLLPGCATDAGGPADAGKPVSDSGKTDAGPLRCSDAGGGTDFPCDIAPIIQAKCQRCHDEPDALMTCVMQDTCLAGPFPLRTWSDTRRNIAAGLEGGRVVDYLESVIEKDVMPYQTDAIQPPVEKLTKEEKATLLKWVRACAPAATGPCP